MTEATEHTNGPADSARASRLVAIGIAFSRVSGLIREILLGLAFGLGPTLDALVVAFRIPNILQNLLGEGVLSASFIPVYARLLEEEKEEEAADAAGAVAGLLAAIAGGLAILGALAAGPITQLLQPGRSAEDLELATELMQIVFLSMGFLVLSAWCLGILNSHRHFFLSYMAPVLWNATQIIVLLTLVLNDWQDVSAARAVAWAMFLGGLLQFLVQLPTVLRVAGPLRPSLRAKLESVKEIRRRFVPAILAKGAVQISTFVDLMLASFLAVGALGAMRFAQTLYILPISIFAMSVAAAELPELSRAGSDNPGEIFERLSVGVARIAFYVSFAALAYLLAGDIIIDALFGWIATLFGSSTWTDDQTLLVWAVLAAYSIGLIGISISRLFQNTCWALGDVAGPTRITVVRLVIAAVVGVLLMFTFDQLLIVDGRISGLAEITGFKFGPLPDALRSGDDLPLRLGAVGLGLGSAVGVWIEYLLLHRRVSARIEQPNLSPGTVTHLLPGLLVAAALVMGLRILTTELAAPLAVLVTIGLPGLAYVAISARLGAQPARALVGAVLRRARR